MTSLIIGGELLGGVNHSDTFTDGDAVTHSGQVFVKGNIGKIQVAGAMIHGPGGTSSGSIFVHGNITGPVTIGTLATELNSGGAIAAVKILHTSQGAITAAADIASITVHGGLTGSIMATGSGNIGAIKIAGDYSGFLTSAGSIGPVTVGGSVLSASSISSQGSMGTVKVHGDLNNVPITCGGGGGDFIVGGNVLGTSHPISFGGAIGRLSVKGSFLGDFTCGGMTSGTLGRATQMDWQIQGNSGPIQVNGSFSGTIKVVGSLSGITVASDAFADITATEIPKASFKANLNGQLQAAGRIGTLTIGGDAKAGVQSDSLGSATINGSLSGAFQITGSVGRVTVLGDVRGRIAAAHLGTLLVGGSVLAPSIDMTTTDGSYVPVDVGEVGQIIVKGDVRGTVGLMGAQTTVVINAGGAVAPTPTTDLAIGKITIGGSVERTQILAGSGTDTNAQIGAVKLGGDWIMSSIAAGVYNAGADDAIGGTGANADQVNFGDSHDRLPAGSIARIASITIGGQVVGSAASGDHFGFVAGQIGSFKAAGVPVKLTAGKDGPIQLAPYTGDVTLHEL